MSADIVPWSYNRLMQSSPATVPDLAPILALHRHRDGYISFAVARDRGEDFRPLVSIRADELARYFPSFREQLMKDSYVSINADWRLAKYGPHGAAYGYPLHRTNRLRYLCAAYCDIDFYRIGKTFGQALGRVVEMQDSGELPRASMIVKSGRGMWLMYLLHDHRDPTRAPGAFPEKLELYFRLQRAIFERLATLGADACAQDAVRHVRVPGSLHTGSEGTVQWSIWGENGSAYSYSLAQLCQLFGVETPKRHVKERRAIEDGTKDPERVKLGQRGNAALNSSRLRDFALLREMRGGFSQGCRNNAALIYAWLLKGNKVPRPDVAVEVNLFGAECHPPLTPSECRGAVKSAYSRLWKRIKDQVVSDRLDIKPEEAAVLFRFPPALRFRPASDPKPKPSEIQAGSIMDRREKITQIIAELGSVPPVREMGRLLIEAGFPGNHQTVQNDYQALGIQSDRTRAARAERKSKQLSFEALA